MHSCSISSLRNRYFGRRLRIARRVIFCFLSCLTYFVLFSLPSNNLHNSTTIVGVEEDLVGVTRPYEHDSLINLTTPPPRTPRILLVSALYRLSHSKHSDKDYADWLKSFLGQITTDVYFFSSPDLSDLVLSSRPSPLPLYLNTTFPTPFSVPPLHNLSSVYTTQHHDLDPERSIHSPELYAVWNAKPYFITQAINNLERQGKTYDYVFWNDAGSFRNTHWYDTWPDPGRVEQVWEDASIMLRKAASEGSDGGPRVEKDDLIFFPMAGLPWFVHRWWKEHYGPLHVDFSEGSFFGGSPRAMYWFSQIFYTYHDHYLSQSRFVGKDQSIYNSLLLLFPDRFITMSSEEVTGMDLDFGSVCCRRWWYYHFWLGDEKGGEKVMEKWKEAMKEIVEGKQISHSLKQKWKTSIKRIYYLWNGKLELPSVENIPPVLLIKGLLQRRFGWGWTPPVRYVHANLAGHL